MLRIDAPEILDSGTCTAEDSHAALAVLGRINRWFGGVATTRKMVERASQATGLKKFSVLEVAAGLGEVPELVRERIANRGITLDVTLLDRAISHLPRQRGNGTNLAAKTPRIVADAMALPFADGSFDLVSCNLFTHHLNAPKLSQFVAEGLRVSRHALLINDLVRHPLHLALVYASYPIMRNRVAWLDGLTSVRRAYIPQEIRKVISSTLTRGQAAKVDISRHYLFRMGVMVWKTPA